MEVKLRRKRIVRKTLLSFLFILIIFLPLKQTFGLDPQLKAKAHDVKVLEIKEEKSDIDKIWSLRENSNLADFIILETYPPHLESAQIEILDNWVKNGGCLWLKEPLPIGHRWELFDNSNFSVYASGPYYGYAADSSSARINLEDKYDFVCMFPHPITEGIKKLVLIGKPINNNFDNDTEVILQFKGVARYDGTYDDKIKYVVPFGTEDFQKVAERQSNLEPFNDKWFQPQLFPILVAKRHGNGKVLFGHFDVINEYDAERFWFNLKEWAVGSNVFEQGNPSGHLSQSKVLAEEVVHIGNLTLISFKPEKEESAINEQVKNTARKLLEITSKKAIKEIINELAGKISSKAFGFVTAVISQMPSVGNPTEIDCYFMQGGDITKRAEMNLGESVGILVYISPGDLLQDLLIELKRDSELVYSEKIPYSFFQERYGYISLIATSQPLSLNEQGEYRLTAVYGGPKSTASLRIR